jgi:hypothetical protein
VNFSGLVADFSDQQRIGNMHLHLFGLEHNYILLTLHVSLLTDTHVCLSLTAPIFVHFVSFSGTFLCKNEARYVLFVDKITNLLVPVRC